MNPPAGADPAPPAAVPLTAILATGPGGLLGRSNGTLPWHEPADLAHFRDVTRGHHLIIGRRTAETLPALPGRDLVVVTTDPARLSGTATAAAASTTYAPDPDTALARAARVDPAPVLAGGGQLYAALWDRIATLWWTHVDDPDLEARAGDVVLPASCTTDGFELVETRAHPPHVTIERYERYTLPGS